ncbi:2',3'-cyclic-nucleotide 2'-phosphodiesterase/5'-or 3'-nucleotidase, 5'-nucleotidase family [Halogranum rubrum]|uniref:2',3'-cyclic-nucleotide 2'-phosphodiesterase/5'-or 3'-nucleotidase, 5'-nucleotidase family n=1 Tax=Halogranum rubrum TaxID=553466 RepID=A0A1I4FBM8_9EURY|nr:bifunctional metallophosphatase/5'-nucleotidase [Halogranum rubrum]SFL15338.1 2',3'-cyclic-nucleotide 2'-phosphodiesterase/5'-or 3'-nucleotidase, 5'-nucleotidase family [Halogranum rubrum]
MVVRLLHYSDLERAFDDPRHAARVAAVVDERRDSQTMVLGTGDNTAPSVLGVESDGRQALDFFNAVGTDFETFGNHDFDYGLDATRALVRDAPNEWLTANIFDDGGERFGDPLTEPWVVTDVDGTRVGLVGVSTTETTTTSPRAASLTVTDPVDAAVDAIAELRAAGATFVVVLAHVGDARLAAAVDADVVLDGHCHDPVVSTHGGTTYVRTGDGGTQVTEVRLEADETPEVHTHVVDDAAVVPDETLLQALSTRITAAGLDEVVSHLDDPIDRDDEAVNCGESRIGNVVTDAIRWATEADTAVIPAGGFCAGPPLSGDVTALDLRRVAPYDDVFQVVECTGADLRATVRDLSLVDLEPDLAETCFGHVSGMRVVWDDEGESLRELTVDGDPVVDDDRYTLATVAYFLQTRRRLTAVDTSDVVTTYHGEHPFVAYARVVGLAPEIEGRIERPTFDTRGTRPRRQTE